MTNSPQSVIGDGFDYEAEMNNRILKSRGQTVEEYNAEVMRLRAELKARPAINPKSAIEQCDPDYLAEMDRRLARRTQSASELARELLADMQTKRALLGDRVMAEALAAKSQERPEPDTANPAKEHPAEAIIWPLMGVSSWHTKHGGAWRLYVLARSLDCAGSGHIVTDTLKASALKLHVKPRTFYAWLADAVTCGIFQKVNGDILRVRNQQTVIRILGGRDIDKSKVIIPLKALFKNHWRSIIWAAYLKANHNEYPISQKKLEDITGVTVRTQKGLMRYVKSKRQYGITDKSASAVPGMNEYTSHGKAFVFIDPQRKNERVAAIHLPSMKTVSDKRARIATRGRRQTILADLISHGLACSFAQLSHLQADNRAVTRLFYSTPKQLKKATRLTQFMSRLPDDPEHVFTRRRRNAWDVLPVGQGVQPAF